MSTVYTNDLRLKEIGTGLESGTWGTSTNTNLSLIAEAFSYQTEATFTADSNFTGGDAAVIADGSTDKYRAMYVKVTSTTSLTATRTLEIGPNTCSKVIFIENATSGGQAITIKQGSGATQTIVNGKSKLLFLEGIGASAGVIDALDKIEIGSSATIGGVTPISADSTTTFTNKTFDADGTGNSLTNVEDANIKASAAIDATKIANGTVSNTEFQHLNGVTSALQTQINNIYPVGSIYMNATNATNPNTLLGFGTWVRFGEGRMVISQHSSNSRWNSAEETGGSEAITLTSSQIPSHRHTIATQSAPEVEYYGGAETSIQEFQDGSLAPGGTTSTYYTGYTGSGGSHDNMPPFITVYMWKRTA
tara:strand:+ start:63 stop:1151 length:1089 start_codon:yes stop_codon:yes gene_type:complete